MPSSSKSNTRRHTRHDVQGVTEVSLGSFSLRSSMRNASFSGIQIAAESLPVQIKPSDSVLISASSPNTQVSLLWIVKHIQKASDVVIGLEHQSPQKNPVNVVQYLVNLGVAQLSSVSHEPPEALGHDEYSAKITRLLEAVRNASLSRLLLDVDGAVLERTVSNVKPSPEQLWHSRISLGAGNFKISFTTQYKLSDVRRMRFPEMSEEDRNYERLCHDFVKEYCNLVCGLIKFWICENGFPDSMFDSEASILPAIKSGKRSVDVPQNPHLATFISDSWELKATGGERISCGLEISVINWETFDLFKPSQEIKDVADKSEEVELF